MRVLPKLVLCAALAMAAFIMEGCFEKAKEHIEKVKDEVIKAACSGPVQGAISDLKNQAKIALDAACDKLDSSTILKCKQDGEVELQAKEQADEAEMTANCTAKWNERFGSIVGAVTGVADWVKNFLNDQKGKLEEYKSEFDLIVERHRKGTEVCNGIDEQSLCESKSCCNWRALDPRHHCESTVGESLCGTAASEAQKLFGAGDTVATPNGARMQTVAVGCGALLTAAVAAVVFGVRTVRRARARVLVADGNEDHDTEVPLHDTDGVE